jgi:hypothetical protein
MVAKRDAIFNGIIDVFNCYAKLSNKVEIVVVGILYKIL